MDLSRYRGLFVTEAREHLLAAHEIASAPGELGARPTDLRDLLRHAHSVKGMAASMGYSAMTGLAHALEDLLDSCRGGTIVPGSGHAALIVEGVACLERMVSAAERGEPVEDPQAEGIAHRIAASRGDPGACVAAEPSPAVEGPAGPRRVLVEIEFARHASSEPVEAAMLLGRLSTLGRVVASRPPVAALRMGRLDGRLEALVESERDPGDFERELLSPAVASVRTRPAPPEAAAPAQGAAPAPWVRVRADLLDAVLERVLELMFEQERLLKPALEGDERAAAVRIDRCRALARELHAAVTEMRLVEFDSVARRLSRAVGDLARRLDKSVAFEVAGRGVRIDRSMLEAIADPLLHMVRNAVDHGIESPGDRKARGKGASGRVALAVERRAERIVIELTDDGRGIDPRALRLAAVERGFLGAGEAAALGDEDALMLATLPGFSTAASVTEVSGRGVGLDAARAGIEAIGGRLEIRSTPGEGTSMRIALPLTLAVIRTLIVRSRGQLFALPLSTVGRMIAGEDLDLSTLTGADDEPPSVVRLDERLGIETGPTPRDRRGPVLLCPSGRRQIALVVDEVLGRKDVVVKPLRPPIGLLKEYSGAALTEDGTVLLVLDPAALAE